MRPGFTKQVCESLIREGLLRTTDQVVAVCAGEMDAELFHLLGIEGAVLTNIDVEHGIVPETGRAPAGLSRNLSWQSADAQNLPFEDEMFDIAFVADGLHHCRAPHQALTEMLRVARRGVIVVESRESVLVRVALRVGLTGEYEANPRLLVTRTRGGADFGPLPNFVFRWTEREFEKTVRCFRPELGFEFRYFHGMSLPGSPNLKHRLARVPAAFTSRLAPRQGNLFAMCAFRSTLQPFLELHDGRPHLKADIDSPAEAVARQKPRAVARRAREVIRSTDPWEGWPHTSRMRFEAFLDE